MSLSLDELKRLYFDLITTIVPGPASLAYFIPLLILPLGLLIPQSVLGHTQLCAIILPISILATASAWYDLGGNDVISTDCLYLTFFLYLFKDPRRDFRRIIRPQECDELRLRRIHKNAASAESRPNSLEAYPDTLSGRLTWAMMLPQSRPLHDWIIGNPGHDRRALQTFRHPSRFGFALDGCSRLVPVLCLLMPLSKQLACSDPYFSDPQRSLFSPIESDVVGEGKMAGLMRATLPPFILRPLIMAMYAYSLLITIFLSPILLAVFLSVVRIIPEKWSPHTWRPHFGPFSAITRHGVRGFWGRWWHQQMRHIVSEPGRWLSAKCGLVGNGWQKTVRYMLICASAFFLSGITHSGLVPPNPRFAAVGANQLRLELAGFFWVQPVGIAFELLALEPVLRMLPMRGLQTCLRVIWTACFLCYSCTYLVLPFGQLGYWNIVPSDCPTPLL
ncbi:hypothetical protein B5807_03981 [Epicoccum nigrum]|uniref:Wax synthase domain-containing protein n=1 Tax=Epicoccum nigrum TaxID=105696 RepID=A0A1Y2M5Q9_EPING|nr:hypothetical protein B5807_03981 [Epicoccum nigrum]